MYVLNKLWVKGSITVASKHTKKDTCEWEMQVETESWLTIFILNNYKFGEDINNYWQKNLVIIF